MSFREWKWSVTEVGAGMTCVYGHTLPDDEVLVVSSDRLSHTQAHTPDFTVKRLKGWTMQTVIYPGFVCLAVIVVIYNTASWASLVTH